VRIRLGADHRGTDAATRLGAHLRGRGHDVTDVDVCTEDRCDYPDKALAVARAVQAGEAELGILVCGSGIGMSIVANKVDGVRAAVAWDDVTAALARRHNDANVLCLSGDLSSAEESVSRTDAWLDAEAERGRHQRRLDKIAAIEAGREPSTITS